MSARQSVLDITVFTLATVDYLGVLESTRHTIGIQTDSGKSAAARMGYKVPVKRRFSSTNALKRSDSGIKTNLNMTAVTLTGPVALLANVKSGSLEVRTNSQESSGIADEWEFHQATGTDYSGRLTLLVPAAATSTLMATAGGTLSGTKTALTLTGGGFSVVLPIQLTEVSQGAEEDGLQEIMVSFEAAKSSGDSVTATGPALLVAALTGTAAIAYECEYTSQNFAGTALIESASIEFNDAAIIRESYSLLGQGAPTIS